MSLPPVLPAAAPFSMLPTVLVQSTMQMLEHGDILRLARCSTFTLQCAEAAFPWNCCPMVKIGRQVSVIPSSRLLRFIPISLQLSLTDGQSLEELFSLMAALRAVHLSLGSVQLHEWFAMRFFSPASRFHSLRSLQIALPSAAALRYVARLPKLETLEVYGPFEDPEILQAMRDAPCLTSLAVSDAGDQRRSCLDVVCSLSTLRRLAIRTPAFRSEGSFLRFATAPCIAHNLTELRLTNWQPMKCTTAELGPAFAAMRALSVVIFEYNNAMNVALRVLHHCPSLTRLSIKNCDYSPKLLLSVLQSLPTLHLELVSRVVIEEGEHSLLESQQSFLQSGLDTPRVTLKLL